MCQTQTSQELLKFSQSVQIALKPSGLIRQISWASGKLRKSKETCLENDLLRLLLGVLGIASFYISYDTIRLMPSSEEGSGNIVHGLIGLLVGFGCLGLVHKLSI
jgi:hypothetical protein